MLKNKYIFENIKTILSTKILQIYILIIIFVFGYFFSSLFEITDYSYFGYLSARLTYYNFIVLCVLPLILLFNVSLLNLYEKNNMLVIRLKSKKIYMKELVKNVIIADTFIFIFILMVVITFQNFTFNGTTFNQYNSLLKINDLTYAIFTIFKLYSVSLIIGLIQIFLFKLFNKYIAFIISFTMIGSVYLAPFMIDQTIIYSITQIPLYFGFYLVDNIEYTNFSVYLSCFLLFLTLFYIFTINLYKVTIKYMRGIGE